MIIWRGYGWLVLAIWLGLGAMVQTLMGSASYASSGAARAGVAVMSAIAVFAVGMRLNSPDGFKSASEYLEELNERSAPHQFFFVPMQWWSLLLLATALL